MLNTITINKTESLTVTRLRESDNYYDSDSTHTSYNIESFSISNKESFYDLMVECCIVPNRSYTLLYALYATGDSFSNHSGKIEYIGLYDTNDDALVIERNIATLNHSQSKKQLTLLTSLNESYKISSPWKGYFESLESVETIELMVTTDE